MRRNSHQFNRSQPRRGLTLIELLVTVGLVAIVIVSISQIFKITSDAAAVTEANASLIQKSRCINEELEREVRNMAADCFLAIVCPPPIRFDPEFNNGPSVPLQVDTIAFIAHGDVGEYESGTDPTRPVAGNSALEDLGPATSAEAIIYFGPGDAMSKNAVGGIDTLRLEQNRIVASDWPFVHRTILLLPELPENRAATWITRNMDSLFVSGGMFNSQTTLADQYANGQTDVVYSSGTLRANSRTFAQLFMNKDWDTDLATDFPSITSFWSRSLAPQTLSVNALATNMKNYYRRSGATFTFGLADFRVEWTDGRPVDPIGNDLVPNSGDENLNTRWFGIGPDPKEAVSQANLVDLTTINDSGDAVGVPYYAWKRQNVYLYPSLSPAERDAEQAVKDLFRDRIEWPRGNNPGTQRAMYRAIWRADTWEYRPKALRFTYRLYDENNRIKNNTEVDFNRDGFPDPSIPGVPNWQMARMGREFSVVIPVP